TERDESLEREAATSDILRMIARSPADLQSVLDAIVCRSLLFQRLLERLSVHYENEHDRLQLPRARSRACNQKPAAGDVYRERVCRRWRPHVLCVSATT